jgi:hypothetical protein
MNGHVWPTLNAETGLAFTFDIGGPDLQLGLA